ncbi:elongation factor P 5-aminopentanone reductase [Pontibacillus litoralis]|uniref:3-ketoacyl-ACP reductase n=1 Tax=Pontibacillus litoralis JSM 072002 TaxID=1385512 RepID=A0A0A5G8J4_9BACI|nr:SDR family oxidoreductase [Pontibacillus litoralis]KGX88379.1 3-ketoacyl-ACP reductase [Pontibacillus litoralis JSM 072002]
MKKVCLIVGASGDIGQAIAYSFAQQGYNLILHYYSNEARVKHIAAQLEDDQVLQTIQANLSTSEGAKELCACLDFHVDAVVFASGKSMVKLFQDVTEDEMDKMYHIHVKAPWIITQHVLPAMIQRRSGTILLISSIWGEIGASCEVIYSAVKGAQDSFVKALAKEVALSNVRVNGIRPGYIDTKMNHVFHEDEKQMLLEAIPAGRFGTPQEVADLAVFLASPQAAYIQGQMLNINGAWSG